MITDGYLGSFQHLRWAVATHEFDTRIMTSAHTYMAPFKGKLVKVCSCSRRYVTFTAEAGSCYSVRGAVDERSLVCILRV